jgi:hypothetical protein
MGKLFFFIYTNDLPNVTISTNLSDNHKKKKLFVDDRRARVNKPNSTDLEKVIHMIFKNTNKRFSSNLLSKNLGKTHLMQFITKHSTCNVMYINYNNKIILNTSTLKFLGITIDNTLSWKSQIKMITPKLSQACHMVRVVKPFLPRGTLKIIIMLTSNPL